MEQSRRKIVLFGAVLLLSLVVAWRLGYFEMDRRDHIVAAVRYARGHVWAPPLYVAAYVLIVILALPATVFTVLGGAVFGMPWGLMLAWSGAMIGSALTHTFARSIGQAPARRFFGRHRLLRRMRDRADVLTLMRLRVLPLAPFGVLGYVAGLANVRLRVLLLATAIAIVPSATAYAYAGQQVAAGLEQSGAAAVHSFRIAAITTGIMVLVSLLPLIRRSSRQPQ